MENGSDAIKLLERREILETRNGFLRCQLGRLVPETRRVGFETLHVVLFHLIGFGSTWEDALGMAQQRLGYAPQAKAVMPFARDDFSL